jgi:hypothetical protein
MTTLADRAALVPIRGRKDKAGPDLRAIREYTDALERETTASLKRDPERWRFRRTVDQGGFADR